MVELLAREPSFVPDVYFSQGYGGVDAVDRGSAWRTIADASGAWQMPLVLAELGEGLSDATSPYGYSGVHIAEEMTIEDAVKAWESARTLLSRQGVVSLFLRFSPFDLGSVIIANKFGGLEVRRSGTTFLVRIDEPDLMWGRMQGRSRTAIRKARRHGIEGLVRPAIIDDIEPGSAFRTLYEATMTRVGASAHYFFDDAYYSGLLEVLGDDLQIVEVRDPGDVVASALVMRHGDRVHYHLSGSDLDGSRLGANSVLVWSIMEWCAESGVKLCHLGGGRTDRDGLALFKRSFGGEESEFHVGRAILDQAAYSRLTEFRAGQLRTTAAALHESGFFPAFRANPSVQ